MNPEDTPFEVVRSLLDEQLLGVLGTSHGGEPYVSLVAIAATDDLRHILFATGKQTRKWENLVRDARASMLVDSRSNRIEDFADAAAVTALGEVEEVADDERPSFLERFLDKHPHLADFTSAPSCALLRLRVRTYILVTRFQHVVELHLD
jgi:nitroimidazol reductase NimA-like FMN-containing flavoprotein (pyridoxamine 5'-phosphate oxidase superfamily)